ncbi:MAG: nucleotidyltransferase domain-containing protein [Candidatus Glassbacteria bacterium]
MESDLLARDSKLREIVHRLVEAYKPERIYLFGSKARGDDGGESDYDIMVVVYSSGEPSYRRAQKAYRILRGIDTAVDVLVWTKQAFDSRLHLKASFPSTIVREGKLLYVA